MDSQNMPSSSVSSTISNRLTILTRCLVSATPQKNLIDANQEIPIARAEGDMHLPNVEVTAIAVTAGEPSARCQCFGRTRDAVPRPQRP